MDVTDNMTVDFPGGVKFEIYQGDLTREEVDAIVNAANSRLKHDGGIADAIVRAGGLIIQEESDEWVKNHGPVVHDQPAVTSAGELAARYVIHAIGPVWGEGSEDEKLRQATQGSLALAERMELESIAFPAISTGVFGFPKERSARVFYDAVWDYFSTVTEANIKLVRIVLYDKPTLDTFLKTFKQWQSGHKETE